MGNQHQGGVGGAGVHTGAGGYSASPSTVPRRSFKQQEPMPLKEEVERRFEELVVSTGSGHWRCTVWCVLSVSSDLAISGVTVTVVPPLPSLVRRWPFENAK